MQFFTALLSALVLAVSTNATPDHVAERSGVVNHIEFYYPKKDVIWHPGEQHHVSWNPSGIPRENATRSFMYLGHYGCGAGENLDLSEPFEYPFRLPALMLA